MASISSQLMLTDGMSAPVRNINQIMIFVLNSELVQRASSKSIDTAAMQEAQAEVAKTEDAVNGLEMCTDAALGAFGKFAKAIDLAGIAREAFSTIKSGIDYVSDLAEVQSIVDVTFGSSSAAIDSWSKECLTAYGMNEVSAKRYAGTIGTMMKSSGLSGESVVGMSQNMVGLAGDMASYYNIDPETAFQKIQSGLAGETAPLEQLGINMSATDLEAFALSQGIDKSYQSMTQAEQVMLRYNYLMNATKDVQGDFARNTDNWTNQTQLLSESWGQFTGILAERLLPALTSVMGGINKVVSFLTENADTVSAVLAGVAVAVGILTVAWMAWTAAKWLDTEANYKMITSLLSSPIFHFALIVGLLIGLFLKWAESIGGVANAWELCKMALVIGINYVKLAFYSGVYGILNFLDLLKLSWKATGVAVADFAGDMKVSVLTILQDMVNGAIDIINDFIINLNKIPGVSISTIEHVTFATTARAENNAKKSARAEEFASYRGELDAAKAERNAKIDALRVDIDRSTNALTSAYRQMKADAATNSAAGSTALDGIGENVAGINENTGSAASSLRETNEDLKYMRDLAEQEAINRFTTAEVKIDMTGMTNRIDSNMDLDGVLTTLTTGFAEALETTAEGVHA